MCKPLTYFSQVRQHVNTEIIFYERRQSIRVGRDIIMLYLSFTTYTAVLLFEKIPVPLSCVHCDITCSYSIIRKRI